LIFSLKPYFSKLMYSQYCIKRMHLIGIDQMLSFNGHKKMPLDYCLSDHQYLPLSENKTTQPPKEKLSYIYN
ncbi:MAG: hypothetical protein M3Q05_02620, partial [Bacteroidota bacterium]|nr:hypothetical protein [Bacteroidota bacterium]